MDQLYYTQCPAGYGLGTSNGAQVKRRGAGYPSAGDLRHLGMRPFVPGTTTLAPACLRYQRAGEEAEVAWLTPRAKEYETEKGLWGRPGGHFAHGLWLEKKELKALANWPAGLFGGAFWKCADPGPSRGLAPEPLVVDAGALRCRPTFAEVAPLAEGLSPATLARLLTALAGAAREGRALFVVDEARRLGDLAGLLTFAFPEALRPALTFSTYHDKPEELPGFRLQGTIPEARPNREALRALGVVADVAGGTFEPAVEPARWAKVLAGWLVHRGPGDGLAWEASDRRARDAATDDAWDDDRLDRVFGLRPAAKPRRPEPAQPATAPEPEPKRRESAPESRKAVGLRRLFKRRGLKVIEGPIRAADGAEAGQLADDAWFRTHVIDPAWAAAPLIFRLVGRARLRWDEFFHALRSNAFATAGGRARLRPDWEQWASRLLENFRDPGPASSESPSKPKPAEVEKTAGVVVGIDLGTTYSVVAYLDAQGRPTSILNSNGDLLTPSVVLFDDGRVVVGKEAVAASAIEPEKVADCVKRDMGAKRVPQDDQAARTAAGGHLVRDPPPAQGRRRAPARAG